MKTLIFLSILVFILAIANHKQELKKYTKQPNPISLNKNFKSAPQPPIISVRDVFISRLEDCKNYQDKENLCTYYIENNPFDLAFLHAIRGGARLDQNKDILAFNDFSKAITLFPKKDQKLLSITYECRASIYEKHKNYLNAINDISESIKNDFSIERVLKRANLYILAGKYIDAIDDCNSVLKKEPQSKIAYYTRTLAITRLNYLNIAQKYNNNAEYYSFKNFNTTLPQYDEVDYTYSRQSNKIQAPKFKSRMPEVYYNSRMPEVYYNSTLKGDRSIIYDSRGTRIERDVYGPGIGEDEYGRQVRVKESYGAEY